MYVPVAVPYWQADSKTVTEIVYVPILLSDEVDQLTTFPAPLLLVIQEFTGAIEFVYVSKHCDKLFVKEE